MQRTLIESRGRSTGDEAVAEVATDMPPDPPGGSGVDVIARIRERQLAILDGDLLSGAANIPAVAVTALVIRDNVPGVWLVAWVFVVTAVIAALVIAVRGPTPWRVTPGWPQGSVRARLTVHVGFTTAVGAVWGAGCLLFGPSLSQLQMMFLTVIVLGCNAACISALGPYLPAFFGYFAASQLPLAYANFTRPIADAVELTILVLLYMVTIAMNVRAYNRNVLAAFRLRAENEALAETLLRANAAVAAEARSKWDTLAHLSHELRTPMTAIIGFSEIMREQMFGALGTRYEDYVGHIYDSGCHALALIDAILEVSHAESGRMALTESETTMAALIDDCLRMVEIAASGKHMTLDRRLDQPGLRLTIDQPKLRQALLNLLSNAIKYTPDGGQIVVTAHRVESGIDIAVEDTGVGIAAEDLQRCLEPFVRLRNPHTAGIEGAGLGLPLARHMVEVQGGSLNITSELGRGTVVTIHLPPERCLAA